MGGKNLSGYKFPCLFAQLKVFTGQIFTTALQKDKSNPAFRFNSVFTTDTCFG